MDIQMFFIFQDSSILFCKETVFFEMQVVDFGLSSCIIQVLQADKYL